MGKYQCREEGKGMKNDLYTRIVSVCVCVCVCICVEHYFVCYHLLVYVNVNQCKKYRPRLAFS